MSHGQHTWYGSVSDVLIPVRCAAIVATNWAVTYSQINNCIMPLICGSLMTSSGYQWYLSSAADKDTWTGNAVNYSLALPLNCATIATGFESALSRKWRQILFYASAQRNVAWGVHCFCPVVPFVCASRNIVNTISCRVFDTFSLNLYQRCIMGQRWTRHNLWS